MTFKYKIETDSDKVDFQEVADVLYSAGLSRHSDANRDITIYIKDGNKVIGVGRALTDFVSQGAIYNVAVDLHYQRQHVDHTIITTLLEKMQGINVILYTHPQTITLYEKYGFRRNKTAFSYFDHGSAESLQWMEDEGFFLPEGYRFDSEKGRY